MGQMLILKLSTPVMKALIWWEHPHDSVELVVGLGLVLIPLVTVSKHTSTVTDENILWYAFLILRYSCRLWPLNQPTKWGGSCSSNNFW